jgi:hypothetical protein
MFEPKVFKELFLGTVLEVYKKRLYIIQVKGNPDKGTTDALL